MLPDRRHIALTTHPNQPSSARKYPEHAKDSYKTEMRVRSLPGLGLARSDPCRAARRQSHSGERSLTVAHGRRFLFEMAGRAAVYRARLCDFRDRTTNSGERRT